MVGRTVVAICAVVGLAAVGTGASTALFSPGRHGSHADDGNLAVLQRIAESSCNCERRAGAAGKAACWAAFDRLMPPDKSTDAFSTCDPVSMRERCFQEPSDPSRDGMTMPTETCVTTGYDYLDESARLCTQEEASAVETLWNREANPDANGHVSTPRADQLARDIVAGKPLPRIDRPLGCNS